MTRAFWVGAGLAVFFGSIPCHGQEPASQKHVYEGMASASGAVAIAPDMFVACCGQDNVLRVYRTEGSPAPIASLDVSGFLGLDGEPADIRGAAKIGERIYWIASHSRDQEGRTRPGRYRFFATTITRKNDQIAIEPVGKPCATLLNELPGLNTVSTLRLDKAMGLGESGISAGSEKQRQRLAPTKEGLYIATLCADPRIDTLLIGFRNPRPVRVLTGRPHALLLPLNNASEVLEKGKAPIFGEATLWDFDGLGITCIAYCPAHRAYFILAQPHNKQAPCVLYRWSGMKATPPEPVRQLGLTDKELIDVKLVPFEGSPASGQGSNRLLLLTSGDKKADSPTSEKHFRGIWIR